MTLSYVIMLNSMLQSVVLGSVAPLLAQLKTTEQISSDLFVHMCGTIHAVQRT